MKRYIKSDFIGENSNDLRLDKSQLYDDVWDFWYYLIFNSIWMDDAVMPNLEKAVPGYNSRFQSEVEGQAQVYNDHVDEIYALVDDLTDWSLGLGKKYGDDNQ